MSSATLRSVGLAGGSSDSDEAVKRPRQDVVTRVSGIARVAEQRLTFSTDLLKELLQGLDSSPGVFNATLTKGQAEVKRLKSRESLTGDLDACSAVLKRRKADLEPLLASRCFGDSARAQILKIDEIEGQIDAAKSGLATSARRVEGAMQSVSDWQKLYAESVSSMGKVQTILMIRGFVERAVKSERTNQSN